jgi:hypothetical protein
MCTALWRGALSWCSIQVLAMPGRTRTAPFSWAFKRTSRKNFDWQFVLVTRVSCGRSCNRQKTNKNRFDFRFAHSRFLGTGRICSVPLPTLVFRIVVVLHFLWFITCDNATEEFWIPLKTVQKIKTHIPPIGLLLSGEGLWNHLGAHYYHAQIPCYNLMDGQPVQL